MKKTKIFLAFLFIALNSCEPLFALDINGNLNVKNGATVNFKVDGSNGNFGMPSGSRFFLDGIGLAGDTYFYESSANVFTLSTGGTNSLVVSASGIQSPTIVTPTIASFTNAQHNHQNAAGGGALSTAALTSGTLPVARGGTGVTTSTGSTNTVLSDSATMDNLTLTGNLNGSPDVQGFWAFESPITLKGNTEFYLDFTDTDYIKAPAAGTVEIVANNIVALKTNSTGEIQLHTVDPPTANYMNSNSFVKAWARCNSNGTNNGVYNATCSRSGVGQYAVNWTTHFVGVSEAISATVQGDQTLGQFYAIEVPASSSTGILVQTFISTTGAAVDAPFFVQAIGPQ